MTDSRPEGWTPQKLPGHVAIIMDGNGRWAEMRGLKRVDGHRRGADTVSAITEEAARLGIKRLTLYAFSLENWNRPKIEVVTLMKLLRRFLIEKRKEMLEKEIRLTAIGRLDLLPKDTRRELERTVRATEENGGINLCLALSYGGRAEIVDAARSLAQKALAGEINPEEIDEDLFSRHLYQPDDDPDLMIRTAGEMRFSNFLLWQASYTEFYITEACWPEFTIDSFHEALAAYEQRVRKFGGLKTAGR
jgi:undecaprenyl diphosphate synthase